MRKLLLRLLPLPMALAAAVAFSTAASASQNTTFTPANAPMGTHVQTGSPTCTVSGLNVSCSSYELAGVGNTDATALLSVKYSATVVCINGGGNPSDSQHQGTFTSTSGPTTFSPKNGRLTVDSLSVTAPTEQQFLSQQTCPNPNWNPTIPGGITLSNFTYTLTFTDAAGNPLFPGAYITITGNDP